MNTTDKPELQHAHSLLDRVPADQMIVAVRFLEFLLIQKQGLSKADFKHTSWNGF